MLKNKMATLLVIVSAMLISAGMTWQQRLLFIGGIVFGWWWKRSRDLVDRTERSPHGKVAVFAGGEEVQGGVEVATTR